MAKKKPRKKTSTALAVKTADIKEDEPVHIVEEGDLTEEEVSALESQWKAMPVQESVLTDVPVKKVPPPPERPTFQDLFGWTTTPQKVEEARKIYQKFEKDYDRWVSENF